MTRKQMTQEMRVLSEKYAGTAGGRKTKQSTRQSRDQNRSPKPKKVYYNEKGGVVYRQSSDKIGDTLINQAGVKYKITGERFAPPTGDPGEVLVRVLKLEPAGHKDTPAFEVNDQMLKYYREKQIRKRRKKDPRTRGGRQSLSISNFPQEKGRCGSVVYA